MKTSLLFAVLFTAITSFAFAQTTSIPDPNFEQALIDLGIDSDGIINGQVFTADIESITTLNVIDENISDLTGIEDFTSLINLSCHQNQLTVLDVSNNLVLDYLSCAQNNLTSLDVSNNIDLVYLNCYGNLLTVLDVSLNTSLEYISCLANQITSLDLSNNSFLTEIYVQQGQLESLNIKNGNNNIITNFIASNNPNLECIEVDDSVSANMNTGVYSSWVIDGVVTYSEDCSNQTFVPDNNFEQELITLGYDRVLNDYVPTANISGVTNLNVSGKNISYLTGIEDFSSLNYLLCYDNLLTELDITQNSNIAILDCGDNNLNALDLSLNTSLQDLYVYNNQISTLDLSNNGLLSYLNCDSNLILNIDVSQNLQLETLGISSNQLNNIDVSQNTNLLQIFAANNQLSSIDLSQNILLTDLWVHNNQIDFINFENNLELINIGIANNEISNIDLSQNPNLYLVQCYNNQLTSLNVKNGNTNNISDLLAQNNPNLECIQVDANVVGNIPAAWDYDSGVTFSDDCEYLGINDNDVSTIAIYPNPVTDQLVVTLGDNDSFQSITLYSITGKLLLTSNSTELDLTNLPASIYLLKVKTANSTVVKKIIKE